MDNQTNINQTIYGLISGIAHLLLLALAYEWDATPMVLGFLGALPFVLSTLIWLGVPKWREWYYAYALTVLILVVVIGGLVACFSYIQT